MRAVVLGAVVLALSSTAASADDDLATRSLVFVRGDSIIKTDARGKTETEIAKLPNKATVRALRVDALGKVLLIDVGGSWSWLPLDGSTTTPKDLPCDAGPAQLAEDGLCVLCRAKAAANANPSSIIVTLATGKVVPVDVPPTTSRLTGIGIERKLVWADATSVWAAPAGTVSKAVKVVPEAPIRNFSVSPDGAHALGVYKADVYETARSKKPGEVLEVFALDGDGARRKVIQNGVPVEWSHDSRWVLIQDGASACIMLVEGGQYKCWKGYTAASISADGKYALILGNRDGSKKQDKKDDKKKSAKKSGKDDKKSKKKAPEPPPSDEDEGGEAENAEGGEGEEPAATDDVAVAPPSGALALYRAELEGAFTKSPALVMRVVDGAAVWLP